MGYNIWKIRNGEILVQKYVGDIKLETILKNDEAMFQENAEKESFNILADLSDAVFPSIDFDEVGKIFQAFDKHSQKSNGMRIAVYTGSNQFEDFKKVNNFARIGSSRPISIVAFNFLDMALNWLGLSENEKEEVITLLKGSHS